MIVQTKGLTKIYNGVNVVNGINLLIEPENVYGFLGPNGSGKTTVMRMLLGLIRADRGDIEIFQKPMPRERNKILKRVGALIEKPAHYEHLNGLDNLKISAKLYGVEDSKQLDWAINIVGLRKGIHKKVSTYSLGMKQRLGIANALLHKPSLLLLDEPTNGLDPEGIHEMRELIRELPKQEGMTILVSSHLLGEIEQIADQIGVIYNGNMLFQGAKSTLLSNQETNSFIISSAQIQSIESVFKRKENQININHDSRKGLILSGRDLTEEKIELLLIKEGIHDYYIKSTSRSLEDAYIELVHSFGENS